MAIIQPPSHEYARARSWKAFAALFAPTKTTNGAYMREPDEIPKGADPRHWWTVVDYDPNGPYLHLVPGITGANRLAVIACEHAWGGSPQNHPLYVYAPRLTQ